MRQSRYLTLEQDAVTGLLGPVATSVCVCVEELGRCRRADPSLCGGGAPTSLSLSHPLHSVCCHDDVTGACQQGCMSAPYRL